MLLFLLHCFEDTYHGHQFIVVVIVTILWRWFNELSLHQCPPCTPDKCTTKNGQAMFGNFIEQVVHEVDSIGRNCPGCIGWCGDAWWVNFTLIFTLVWTGLSQIFSMIIPSTCSLNTNNCKDMQISMFILVLACMDVSGHKQEVATSLLNNFMGFNANQED